MMNNDQNKHYKDFKSRLVELDIIEGRDYNVTTSTTDTSWLVFESVYDPKNTINSCRIQYCIMGMIYHFNNRKWIVDISYMYIMKGIQLVKFNDGTQKTN